ncbi:MFS transporter [Aeromonas rivipollensis]
MLLKVLLFFIAFLVGADELMLGPLLTPIGRELGVQPERVTLFITAYSLALAMIAPLLGSLSDRLGRVRIMLPAALLFGAASIATGLVDSFEWGLASRVLTGLASAGMLPIAFAMAADGTGKDAMKRIAWVQSGLTLGMIASPALGLCSRSGTPGAPPLSCSASVPGGWRRPWPCCPPAGLRQIHLRRSRRRRVFACWPSRVRSAPCWPCA